MADISPLLIDTASGLDDENKILSGDLILTKSQRMQHKKIKKKVKKSPSPEKGPPIPK